VIFGLEVGARGDPKLLSPVLAGSVSIVKERWEIGLMAASEAQYTDIQTPEPIPPEDLHQGSALALGASVGRREPALGMALRAGCRASIAALFHESLRPPSAGPTDDRGSEGRLGVYVGMAAPRRFSIRFRADLAGEAVVTDFAGAASTGPRWSLTALVGAEIGGT